MTRKFKFSFLKYPILYGFLVFLALLLLTQLLTYQRYRLLKNEKHLEIVDHANWVEDEFEKVLNQSFAANQTLAFIVENYGVPKNFDSIAKLLLQTNKNLNALELVDSTGVITHVYPLEENNILGFNILKDSIGKKGANITISRKDYFVAGPIHLKQGGDGFVSRIPIFKGNSFKGFSAAVIKLPGLIDAIQLRDSSNNRFSYQLVKINADKSEELFFSSYNGSTKDEYSINISMTDGEWKLYVIANDQVLFSSVFSYVLLGLILSILGGVFTWYLFRQPVRLSKLVNEKTALLKANEEKYRGLIEQASDGIFLTDQKGNFLDVNIVGCQMSGYSKEEILKMNVGDIILYDTPSRQSDLLAGKTILHERMLKQKNGSKIFIEVNAKKLLSNNIQAIVRDISERKKLELDAENNAAKLKESEEKYRTLVEQASDGIILSDSTGKILEANIKASAIFGYTKSEFQNLNIVDLVEKEHLKMWPLQMDDLRGGKAILNERKMLRKNGTPFYAEINAKLATNGLLQGIIRDITYRVKAQEELRESQEKFYKSFHSNLIGKVIVDEHRNILEANGTIAKLLETTREKLIGKKLIDADVLDFKIHEQSEKRQLLWNKLLDQGFLSDEELTYTLKSGKRIPALISIEPLKLENKNNFLVSAIDNTKRKEAEEELLKSEERFRKLASTTPVGIFQTDATGSCTYVNEEWLKYTGMEFEEAMDFGWVNAIYEQDKNRVIKEWKKTVTKKKELATKFRFQHKNGNIIISSVKATPLFGLDDHVVGFIGMASDITSLINVEQQLEVQNIELLKTNSELDRFVYSASHELRAPLASVLGLIDIILSEEKEEGLIFKLQMMQQSVNRLDSFIKDIVQYSQNKHIEIANDKLDFRNLVNNSLESLWYLENRSQINIQVKISDDIEFYSDKKRISVVLNNLISNAIKYHNLESSNPVINIVIKTTETNAQIKISDNGVGIPEEHLNKIFNMFYRVSSKVMGTGIGLYVVKEIIEKINGEITVESVLNKGTTFNINLPNQINQLHEIEKSIIN